MTNPGRPEALGFVKEVCPQCHQRLYGGEGGRIICLNGCGLSESAYRRLVHFDRTKKVEPDETLAAASAFFLQVLTDDSGRSMPINEYMRKALSTALLDRPLEAQLDNAAFGLAGEVGEILDHIKKWKFHEHDLNIDHLKKELGDVLWYISLMCWALQFSMDTVARTNIEKLAKRYPGGKFDAELSKGRVGADE